MLGCCWTWNWKPEFKKKTVGKLNPAPLTGNSVYSLKKISVLCIT